MAVAEFHYFINSVKAMINDTLFHQCPSLNDFHHEDLTTTAVI